MSQVPCQLSSHEDYKVSHGQSHFPNFKDVLYLQMHFSRAILMPGHANANNLKHMFLHLPSFHKSDLPHFFPISGLLLSRQWLCDPEHILRKGTVTTYTKFQHPAESSIPNQHLIGYQKSEE